MKKYKCWVEYEETIEAKDLNEALVKFERSLNIYDMEVNGVEIKNEKK